MAITTMKTSRDFLRIWFYWKKSAMIIFCIIVISICLYSFTQVPIYEATAKLLVLPKTQDELVVSAGKGSRQYDIKSVDDNDINTEIQLIRSREVVERTIASFSKDSMNPDNLLTGQESVDGKNQTENILDALSAEPIYSSNMILVSLESLNRETVAELLNKHLETYLKYHQQMSLFEQSEDFYGDQKMYYEKRLKLARERLNKFNDENNFVNMESEMNANIGLISAFNEQLQNLEIAIAENEARITMVKDGLDVKGDDIIISKEMRSMPVIVELAHGLVPLLIMRTEIGKTFTKESREYRQIDSQIEMLRQEIRKEGLSAIKTDMLENETRKAKRDALEKRLVYIKAQIQNFPQKKQELHGLELDLEIAKKNYLMYGSKAEASRMYSKRNQSGLSNVIVAESAIVPDKAKSPKRLLAFQVSIFLGLFAAFILPFILETLDQKLKHADDIENVLSLPVICTYNEVA